jgi:hypothetical protein
MSSRASIFRWLLPLGALALTVALAACGDDEQLPTTDLSAPAVSDLSVPVDGDAGPDCYGDGGCYECPPKSDTQFLNQCTTANCSHFDNGRLPLLLPGGKLPPLP